MKRILNNARLILADGVVKRGALEIDNGVIAAIHAQALSAPPPHSEDLDGDDLLPGLVEVHTDNLKTPDAAQRRAVADTAGRGHP